MGGPTLVFFSSETMERVRSQMAEQRINELAAVENSSTRPCASWRYSNFVFCISA